MQTEEQTIIYYSKKKTVREIRAIIVFFTIGLLMPIIFYSEIWAWFFGIFLMAFLTMVGLNVKKYYSNRQPQIIISRAGIQTSKIPFIPWKDIKGEDVVQLSDGKNLRYFLIYDHTYGHAKHPLTLLDTDDVALSRLLKMYREKSRQEETSTSGNPLAS